MSEAQQAFEELRDASGDDRKGSMEQMRTLIQSKAQARYYGPPGNSKGRGYNATSFSFPDGSGIAYLSNPDVGEPNVRSVTVYDQADEAEGIVSSYASLLGWAPKGGMDYSRFILLDDEPDGDEDKEN